MAMNFPIPPYDGFEWIDLDTGIKWIAENADIDNDYADIRWKKVGVFVNDTMPVGATGTFTAQSGETITVENGLVTLIV